jgi:hypothetical protein
MTSVEARAACSRPTTAEVDSLGAKQVLELNEALLVSRDLLQTADTSQPCLAT